MKKPEIKIKTIYEGVKLEGRIVSATDRLIEVKLDKPVKGEGYINFGYASAMAGKYVFKDNDISKAGMEGAKTALGWCYDRAETKRVEKKFGIEKKERIFYSEFIKGVKFTEKYYEAKKK